MFFNVARDLKIFWAYSPALSELFHIMGQVNQLWSRCLMEIQQQNYIDHNVSNFEKSDTLTTVFLK
jgi:hypothetical protein